MKKFLALSTVVLIIATACHKKTVPSGSVTAYATGPSEVVSTDPAVITAGQVVFTTKCTKCHAAKVVGNYTGERWDAILKSMIPKAKIDTTEAAEVTAYVHANAKMD